MRVKLLLLLSLAACQSKPEPTVKRVYKVCSPINGKHADKGVICSEVEYNCKELGPAMWGCYYK